MPSRMEPVIIRSQPLTSSSKLVPRALFHRSRRQGHTRLYRLPSSAKRTESKLPAFPIFPFVFLQPGVRSFRMDDTGKVHVSGYIEPNVLLKCLRKNGKEAHLVHWQYGECSTNLYQNNSYQNSGFQRGGYQNSGYHQGGYGGYDNNNGNASKWGFFQIVNHGVPYHVLDDVKDATRKFFALPAEEKLKYSKEKSVTTSIRFGTSFIPEAEKALEWKDYLSLFFVSDDEAATLWPSVCRNQALEYIKSSKLVVKKLLMILLNGLNVKEIDEAKESKLMGSKRINLNYYPKCPNPELTVGVGRHSDVSTLTILLQDEIGGLYVRNMDTMKWIHVPPVSGSLVINVGDALQIISNGKYKSVEHRVSANGSSNRISVPIFVNPRPSDVIGPLQELIDSGEKPLYKNVVYSDYVKHFFRKAHDGKATIDFAKMKAILRKDKCLAAIGERPAEVTDYSKWDEMDGNAIANLHLALADGVLSSIEEKEKRQKEIWE
ncbi:feruloyl CoA ortho-hydroxylase 1-like protein [Tanacetum coccineum]